MPEFGPRGEQVNPSEVERSHIIKLKPEFRGVIERKLEEYKDRFEKDSFKSPEDKIFNEYKKQLLDRLLRIGEVNTDYVLSGLEQQYGKVDTALFEEACGVAKDYATTGGLNTYGGTGTQ